MTHPTLENLWYRLKDWYLGLVERLGELFVLGLKKLPILIAGVAILTLMSIPELYVISKFILPWWITLPLGIIIAMVPLVIVIAVCDKNIKRKANKIDPATFIEKTYDTGRNCKIKILGLADPGFDKKGHRMYVVLGEDDTPHNLTASELYYAIIASNRCHEIKENYITPKEAEFIVDRLSMSEIYKKFNIINSDHRNVFKELFNRTQFLDTYGYPSKKLPNDLEAEIRRKGFKVLD